MATETTNNTIEPFIACAVQYNWEFYNPNLKGEFEGKEFKERNLKRMCDSIDACCSRVLAGKGPR